MESKKITNEYGTFDLERVIGWYDVWTVQYLPFAVFTIRVVASISGGFQASPNVVVRNSESNCLEYTCGVGATVEIAVTNALSAFLGEVEAQRNNRVDRELLDEDFVWMNWTPFGETCTITLDDES